MGVGVPAALRAELPNLVGRNWVAERLTSYLKEADSQFFLFTGYPGAGKSLLLAKIDEWLSMSTLATRPEDVIYTHFCRVNDPESTPIEFVNGLANALAARVPAYLTHLQAALRSTTTIHGTVNVGTVEPGGLAAGVYIGRISTTESATSAFHKLIAQPLAKAGWNSRLVVLIDSLDEARVGQPPQNEIMSDLLRSLLDRRSGLPANTKFIVTSRPDHDCLRGLPAANINLSTDPAAEADIVEYTLSRLDAAANAGYLAHQIAQRVSGNFLYIRRIFEAAAADAEPVNDAVTRRIEGADRLPDPLTADYEEFLTRELARRSEAWATRYRPILGVLSIAQGDGIQAHHIQGATGVPRSRVDDALRACGQLLSGDGLTSPARLFHASFRDFLLSSTVYSVYPDEAEEHLTTYLVTLPADTYTERYAVHHLLNLLKRTPDDRFVKMLTDLFCSETFLTTQITSRRSSELSSNIQRMPLPDDGTRPFLLGLVDLAASDVASHMDSRYDHTRAARRQLEAAAQQGHRDAILHLVCLPLISNWHDSGTRDAMLIGDVSPTRMAMAQDRYDDKVIAQDRAYIEQLQEDGMSRAEVDASLAEIRGRHHTMHSTTELPSWRE